MPPVFSPTRIESSVPAARVDRERYENELRPMLAEFMMEHSHEVGLSAAIY